MATAFDVRQRWARRGGDATCIKCGSSTGALQFSHAVLGGPHCQSCASLIEQTEIAALAQQAAP